MFGLVELFPTPASPGSLDLGSPQHLNLFSLSHQPGLCTLRPIRTCQSPRAELPGLLLIRLPPAPKLAALSPVCLEPAAASCLGVLDAFSSPSWASRASRLLATTAAASQTAGGGSQGLAPATNLPALSRRRRNLHSFLLRLCLLRFPHSPGLCPTMVCRFIAGGTTGISAPGV